MTESEKKQRCVDIKEDLDAIENLLVKIDIPKEEKNPIYDQVSKARCKVKHLWACLDD